MLYRVYHFRRVILKSGEMMKRFKRSRISFLFPSLISFLLFIPTLSYGAGDPGAPDTVRFESWGTYIPCPPCTGHAVVPMVIFNDDSLTGIEIPLMISGPAAYDTTVFTGRALSFDYLYSEYLGYDVFLLLGSSSGDPEKRMPAGNGVVAYIHLTLNDTGLVKIEKPHGVIIIPWLHFVTSGGDVIIPVLVESEQYIFPQSIIPGDLNESGDVTIVDVVFLINYLFRNGPEPSYPPCADPNIDCSVTIADAVYLVNYVFRNGSEPQLGCAD